MFHCEGHEADYTRYLDRSLLRPSKLQHVLRSGCYSLHPFLVLKVPNLLFRRLRRQRIFACIVKEIDLFLYVILRM